MTRSHPPVESSADEAVDTAVDTSIDIIDTDDEATIDGARFVGGGPRRGVRKGPQRRVDRGLLAASFAIACGLMLIGWALTVALTGDDGIDRPDAIEAVQPVENAIQVLRQERIVVDLVAGYEGRLVLDGVELPTTRIGETRVDPDVQAEPGRQVDLPTTAVFDPGNAILSFQPVEGAAVETFTQGRHEVQVIFWRIEDGPGMARSYRWTFDVI